MKKLYSATLIFLSLCFSSFTLLNAQTLSFPGAEGFGRFALGARGAAVREVYIVTNLNDAGAGSFRDAVSKPGRIVTFAVGGIIRLTTDVVVSPNVTIAGQTAPGDGVVFFNKRITFSSASNAIARYLRIRLGATDNAGKDASGLANGANMIFDHMSFTWAMDEVFSINWDGKGTAPDNITIQNSIIGQALHRENHSAGGLIQTPDGGKVSLLKNLYISNKTRNPKVKGVNEFVNNIVYNYGNANRLGDQMNYGWSGEGYIMGGTSGISEVNIINNYFVGGPSTPPAEPSPFSRGTGTFNLYGAGNYFDNNKNGILDGYLVPYNSDPNGYPGIAETGFKTTPFAYPAAFPTLTAEQAYQHVIDNVGPNYPRRDQVDALMVDEVASKGIKGVYVYRETDVPLTNGGLGQVFSAPAPLDTDADGMPDAWEDANGLNKNSKADAIAFSTTDPNYLNIEVYINSIIYTVPPAFVKPPTNVTLSATSTELPTPSSTVTINWVDNADNEDYFILERSPDGISFTDIFHPAANATSYLNNTGLVPNTNYYYRLKAVNALGESAYSTPVLIKTPPIASAPVAPTTPTPSNGFQYVELAQGKATLKWLGSSNTTTFAVYFGTDPANLVKKADIAYVAAPSYQVTGLSDFITYYWRITATNNKGTTEGPLWSFRTTKTFPAGLVNYLAFDETEGIEVTDSSEYENHGVLGLDDDDASIRVEGKVKGGVNFATANTNMYVVSVPHQDQLYLDKGSFSLSFWMKAPASLLPPDNNTSAYLLCKGSITKNLTTGATGKRFDIEFKNRQFRFAIDDDVTKYELAVDGTGFFTNSWVHVVAIRDTATNRLRLYLNGTKFSTEVTTTAGQGIGEASDLVIGNIGALEFLTNTNAPAAYRGMLDELKIFNYSLSADQVIELYHTSPFPIQANTPSPINGGLLEGYSNSVGVSWKGGFKTTSYKVYFGTDPANLAFVSDATLVNPTSSFSNLNALTTYYWRVDAIGPAGTTTGETWSFRAVSPKGMVGHWKLDETTGTIAADNSNYHQNGNVTGMPEATWLSGKFDNGLQFKNPTATGAVSVPHAEHLQFDQNAFTISMWIKLTNGSSNYNSATPAKDCYIIQKGQFTDPGGKWYGIQLRDSALVFSIDDAAIKSSVTINLKKASPFFIFNNNWSNIIALKDSATKTLKVYINGALAGSAAYTTTGTIGKALPLLIGNSLENKAFHDVMDDVRLYNYALSVSEIQALNNGVPLVSKVTNPVPANNANDVNYGDVASSWSGTAQTYNVYFGDAPGNLTLLASALTDKALNLENLNQLKSWYWRVDAIRDGEVATGDVWTFATVDKVQPTVKTKDITIFLDQNGSSAITPQMVDDGSTDFFGVANTSLSKLNFDCSNVGENTVVLTVTDNNGNIATGEAKVTVVDNVSPNVVTKNIPVVLRNGLATILASDINDGSSDACGIETMVLDKTRFNCSNIGSNTVNLLVTDKNGNSKSLPATVTVTGAIPSPSVTVSRLDNTFTGGDANTIYLGYGAQELTLTASNNTGSTWSWSPATGLSNSSIANPVFTPTQAGEYTFVATATNEFGCAASATITITVIDARCGNKIVVCHNGHENCLSKSAVQAHLRHGCRLGACPTSSITTNAGSLEKSEELIGKAFTIFPNPASTTCVVNFETGKNGTYTIELLSTQGQLLRVLKNGAAIGSALTRQQLNVSDLSSGVYFLKLVTERGTTISRLVVKR